MQAVGPGVRAQHHERLRLQKSFRIGFRHHRGFQHRGMGDQRALDLERRHPDARHLEHVVAAAAKRIAPLGVADVFVAGAGPVALKGLAAFAALIPVAFAGGRRIDQQFADLAIGHVAPASLTSRTL